VNNAFGLLGELLSYIVENKTLTWIPKGMLGIVWDLVLEAVKLQGSRIVQRPELMSKFERLMDIISKKCFVLHTENKFDFIRFYRGLVYVSTYLKIGIRYLHKLEIVS
jgi:hypothetical protein